MNLKECIIKHLNDIYTISSKDKQLEYINDMKHFRVALIRTNNEQYGYIDFIGNNTAKIIIFNQKILNKHGITIKLKCFESIIYYQFYINREHIETLGCAYSSLDIILNLRYKYKSNNLFRFLIRLNWFTERNLY